MQVHKAAQAAREQAIVAEQTRQEILRNTAVNIEHYKLSILHIRPQGEDGVPFQRGGMTIAYRFADSKQNLIEMATSVCHRNDPFCKYEGRWRAVSQFVVGKTVMLPIYTHPISVALRNMFFVPMQIQAGFSEDQIFVQIAEKMVRQHD